MPGCSGDGVSGNRQIGRGSVAQIEHDALRRSGNARADREFRRRDFRRIADHLPGDNTVACQRGGDVRSNQIIAEHRCRDPSGKVDVDHELQCLARIKTVEGYRQDRHVRAECCRQ